jgi:hypothetical protein
MKNIIALSFLLFISSTLFSQTNITYKNHYEITVVDINNEELAKITIGHLRKITTTKRCDFDNNNDTFSIKTNTKIAEFYLTNELNKLDYTLLTFTIINED